MSIEDDSRQTVQDSAREAQMRERFGLLEGGSNRQGIDAIDELGNPFELKSATRSGVTTGRDVGIHTLQRYRSRYWLICRGDNLRRSGFVVSECRFLSPAMLESWFAQVEARLLLDLALLDRVIAIMGDTGFNIEEIARLRYLVYRGYTLNNPKIPWHYVEKHGIRIEGDPKAHLRRLVAEHPLHQG